MENTIDYHKFAEALKRIISDPNRPAGDPYLLACREVTGNSNFVLSGNDRAFLKASMYYIMYSPNLRKFAKVFK